MADLGMTIVTVVHQPRYGIFVLFDEVLLLGKSGRTVFQGPSTAALPYFNSLGFELPPNENPADFCLDVISGSIPCQGRPDFRPEVHSCSLLLSRLLADVLTHYVLTMHSCSSFPRLFACWHTCVLTMYPLTHCKLLAD